MGARTPEKLLAQRPVKTLVLLDGSVLYGNWTFESQGAIGAYPRYVDELGNIVFLHAVAVANP
jgi:hypothetical protein